MAPNAEQPGPIEHDRERGVFRRDWGGFTIETDDLCSVCGEKSDEPIICSRCMADAEREDDYKYGPTGPDVPDGLRP